MIEERTGEAFEFDEPLTVLGRQLQPGDQAPDFELPCLDPATGSLQSISLADSADMVRILNVVNSLDTPVCQVETRQWDHLRPDLPADIAIFTISMDLPFAQARWASQEGVQHQALSAHKSEQFGREYGVLIKEWRLLQRAVFVIDRADRVVYVEYVADQMHEPVYEPALHAAREAAAAPRA